MGNRGRRSAVEFEVIPGGGELVRPPPPPPDLPPDEQSAWNAVVAELTPDYFRPETLPLLEQFSRHLVRARHIAQLISEVERSGDMSSKRYFDLLRMEQQQTQAIV